MQKIVGFIVSVLTGFASAIALVIWSSDVEVDELGDNFKVHLEEAMEAGRKASVAKKQELEEEIAEMSAR